MTQKKIAKFIGPFLAMSIIMGCSVETPIETRQTANCAPLGLQKTALMQLRENGFEDLADADTDKFAIALLPCLADKDPDLRDKIAYEGLRAFLRNERVSSETLSQLKTELLNTLIEKPQTVDGFEKPFAALVLSEVSRMDRVTPRFNEEERAELVIAASEYLQGVRDYRGFDNHEGWRHGVAHGADFLMQLSLNPNVTPQQQDIMRQAVASQVMAHNGHAYIYGEPERLARPILFLALKGDMSEETWQEWFADLLTNATPPEGWETVFSSEEGLARLHNLKAFANTIYVNATNSTNENIKLLAEPALDIIKALP